ncbi:MAG: hypothetical protein ACM3JI_01390, partial [Anaerolineae bacterium]
FSIEAFAFAALLGAGAVVGTGVAAAYPLKQLLDHGIMTVRFPLAEQDPQHGQNTSSLYQLEELEKMNDKAFKKILSKRVDIDPKKIPMKALRKVNHKRPLRPLKGAVAHFLAAEAAYKKYEQDFKIEEKLLRMAQDAFGERLIRGNMQRIREECLLPAKLNAAYHLMLIREPTCQKELSDLGAIIPRDMSERKGDDPFFQQTKESQPLKKQVFQKHTLSMRCIQTMTLSSLSLQLHLMA